MRWRGLVENGGGGGGSLREHCHSNVANVEARKVVTRGEASLLAWPSTVWKREVEEDSYLFAFEVSIVPVNKTRQVRD